MSDQLESKIRLDYIRYANCWEDADLLVEGLQLKTDSRVLSIASGGDNSFALLAQSPEYVLACDFNEVQLHLCELKKVAIQQLSRSDVLQFLGFEDSTNRTFVYRQLRSFLSENVRSYWDMQPELIENGIIHQGKFERYFLFFRKWILPLIHGRKKREELFRSKSPKEQSTFYKKRWNTWRWRLLFRIFFSKAIMGKYGRDPKFLEHVKVSVPQFIFQQAEKHLSSTRCQENYFLHYILLGNFGMHLPYYLREEYYETIKSNLHRIEFRKANVLEIIRNDSHFTHFNFSNIFEYFSEEDFKESVLFLSKSTSEGARFFFWNLMCPRSFADILPKEFQKNSIKQENDMGFFYLGSRCETRV